MYNRLVNWTAPMWTFLATLWAWRYLPCMASHYMCGCLGWLFGWLTWGNLDDQLCASIFPASTLHWLRGVHPAWLACMCVCAQGDGGSHTWGGNRELLGQLLLAWNSLPLPGLETTTARSCHQSANVVGEIYTETLKKQKVWGKNSNSFSLN